MAFPFGIWGMGDKAGGRMAFKDAWPAARAKYGDQVEVSLGHHKASRAAAVLDAVRTGMIEQRAARLLLPQLTDAEFAGMQRSLPSQTGVYRRRPIASTAQSGRAVGASRRGVAAIRRAADQLADNIRPVIHQIEAEGYSSLRDIAEQLNRRGVKTARGGVRCPTTVKNIQDGQGGRLVRFLTGAVAG